MLKKGQAIRMVIMFIVALLVLSLIIYIIYTNTQQNISLIEQANDIFG